ncbi:MAG: GNAT family N-acetyltransferase [Caldilinea sp.]|nr:GNAT family N-acetyltransferase [Caldilinea sp.]MCB9117429.1 GNAT family N-acetyltransferase [Caldilineaceae bacterium]MCB9119345.1 GNAT family N-acetyltransferase [Caldilineaceae bacterium]MCO5209377.1 GNAT family N-acetyltransferase [Caldilinea sp.]MCW5843814.1 GNAT family N-acetyltransferase [Caldilinea sp.]
MEMVVSMAPFKRKSDVTRRPVRFTTRDGRKLTLRLIRPADAPLLEDLFYRLSPESRWRRFHALTDGIPPERIAEQAGTMANVDNRTLEGAVVAVAADDEGDRIVGVVRLARPPGKPDAAEAEAAVVVLDEYQGQGVGSELLQRMLQLARHMRVKRMLAVFQPDNAGAIRLFRDLGLPSRLETSHGISKMYTELPE